MDVYDDDDDDGIERKTKIPLLFFVSTPLSAPPLSPTLSQPPDQPRLAEDRRLIICTLWS